MIIYNNYIAMIVFNKNKLLVYVSNAKIISKILQMIYQYVNNVE